jgi:hypothetical protein
MRLLYDLSGKACGVLLTSSTSVRDLATQNDTVRTTLDGFIRSASVVGMRHVMEEAIDVEMEMGLNRARWAFFLRA